MKTIYTVYH